MLDLEEFVTMDPKELTLAPPFSDLFPRRPAVEKTIKESMLATGYDMAQPVAVWQPPTSTQMLVVDGNQRTRMAQELGIDVPVVFMDFGKDIEQAEDRAIAYAISRQMARRNLTDGEIRTCIELLYKRKQKGGYKGREKSKASSEAFDLPAEQCPDKPKTMKSKAAEDLANQLGIHRTKVEKAVRVNAFADEKTKAKVDAGETTINAAYEEVKKKKNEQKPQSPTPSVAPTSKKPVMPDILRERLLAPASQPHINQPQPAQALSKQSSETATDMANPDVQTSITVLGAKAETDIRLFYRLKPIVMQMEQLANDIAGPAVIGRLSPYRARLHAFLATPDPITWTKCKDCTGIGFIEGKGECQKCKSRGYQITRIKS